MFRKQREKFYNQKSNMRYKGLNRMNGGWRIANCNFFWKKSVLNFQFVTVLVYFWQCWVFLNQSDVKFIKNLEYITDRILGVGIFHPKTVWTAKTYGLASFHSPFSHWKFWWHLFQYFSSLSRTRKSSRMLNFAMRTWFGF